MKIHNMTVADIPRVIPLYLDQYNRVEGGCWTEDTATRRIRQVLTMEDSFSLIMTDTDRVCGFVMGYFKQYDDILGYTLEEIVIDPHLQNRGLGTRLLSELESRVRSAGAACIELQAVNDEMHRQYYEKAGFKDAKNFVLKAKWF